MRARPERGGALGANLGAAVAAVFFGASVVAVRVAVRDVPPVSLAFLRFGIGGLLLLLLAVTVRRDALRLDREIVPRLALLALVFYALFPLSFNVGLQFTEASRGALMLATMPVWSAIMARKAVGESPAAPDCRSRPQHRRHRAGVRRARAAGPRGRAGDPR